MAYSLEKGSEHPLAKAILQKAEEEGMENEEVTEFQALPAMDWKQSVLPIRQNLSVEVLPYIENLSEVSTAMKERAEKLAEEGKTPLLFAKDGVLQGMIAVADVMKEDSAEAIRELKEMGIRVVMLTGDNERTAKAIGELAGVDEVIADVLRMVKRQLSANFAKKVKWRWWATELTMRRH